MSDLAEDLGTLPTWDLADLFPGRDSAALATALDDAAAEAADLVATYKGTLGTGGAAALAAAIRRYEALDERIGRIMSFAYLEYAGDMTDPAIGVFFQNTQERINAVTADLLFFTLEINRIEEAVLAAWLADSADLAHYRPWLRDVRAFRAHQLADDVERLLHEKDVAGRAAWTRLFDETLAALTHEIDGRTVGTEEALHLLSDADRATRAAAARGLSATFGANLRTFALITNTLAKDKEIEDRWRGFADIADSRHLANHVEAEVVDALVCAVRDAYPRLSHRYYSFKARWMGLDRLEFWDRNAPLPGDDDRIVPWDEARDVVLEAYGAFAPEMAAIGRRFFDNAWIDAPLRAGKAPGAFAHPTVPGVHPYILLNYQGKTRDVMTLAHELGHGVHQVLAAEQGALMADTPLTLAETASVFGEQLTFRALLARETDPARRRLLLAGKVEDMLNTVVRQVAFYEFERAVHAARREGEVGAEALCDIWMRVQTDSLGPAFRFDDAYRPFWTYIPHFVHSPFYVYAYAFGDCLVNALYAVYQDAEQGFQQRYFDMLRAGGTLRHKELLAPFGLDASDPTFWAKGLGVIEGFIDRILDEETG